MNLVFEAQMVYENSLGIHFQGLERFSTAHYGKIWNFTARRTLRSHFMSFWNEYCCSIFNRTIFVKLPTCHDRKNSPNSPIPIVDNKYKFIGLLVVFQSLFATNFFTVNASCKDIFGTVCELSTVVNHVGWHLETAIQSPYIYVSDLWRCPKRNYSRSFRG